MVAIGLMATGIFKARHPKLVSLETAQGGRGGGPLHQGYVD